jgi:hypothetical protein
MPPAPSVRDAGRLAALYTVKSRGGQTQRGEQRIQIFDAAAAHQREGAAQPLRDLFQHGFEFVARLRVEGSLGEFDQRSVDVQKQAPVERWRRRTGLLH